MNGASIPAVPARTLSRNEEKLLRSLRLVKYRLEHQLFVAEGARVVEDLLLEGLNPALIAALPSWISQRTTLLKPFEKVLRTTDQAGLKRISSFQAPQAVVAAFPLFREIPSGHPLPDDLILVLDGIRDPGNMGTMIRSCDWFGIGQLVCTPDCVDLYNPKVVQASMGSLARVRVRYIDEQGMAGLFTGRVVCGAAMDGEMLYDADPGPAPVVVIGNEARGIREEMAARVDRWLAIPGQGDANSQTRAESLNAAVAASIMLAEFRRRQTNQGS